MCEKYNKRRPRTGLEPLSHRIGSALRASLADGVAALWSPACVVCHRAGEAGIDLCAACRDTLPGLVAEDGRLCPYCGALDAFAAPDADDDDDEGMPVDPRAPCSRCAARLSPFARLVVPWRYAFPLDGLIRRMKYHRVRTLARVLGTQLAREARAEGTVARPDVLIAVPSRAARRERGFDHAAALARWCAREADVPDASALAVRVVDTGSLAGLSRAARQDRIRGAFRVDERVAGRHVAIVDDVLTSGATAGELTRELYDTGAASVELWVLARTPAPR